MTDRLKGCFVAFERDIRVDDAEATLEAIQRIKGVLSVSASVSEPADYVAEMRAKHDFRKKVQDFLTDLST